MTRTAKWEFFPATFYTTKFDHENFRLQKDWNRNVIIPEIENDLKKGIQQNDNWNCIVKTNFHKDKNCLDKYKKIYAGLVEDYFRTMRIEKPHKVDISKIWYNVYYEGDYQEIHTHWPDQFSFVHYVEYDKDVHQPTIFQNPNLYGQLFNNDQINDRMFENNVKFETEENSVVCFPSHIPHYVPKNNSNKRRITVSFNANIIF